MKCTSRTSQGICTQRPERTALASWAIFLRQHGIKLVKKAILSNKIRRTRVVNVHTSTGSCCSNFQQQDNDAEEVTHVTCKPKNIHDFNQVLLLRKWGCSSDSSCFSSLQVLRPTVDTNDCYDEGFFYPCNGPEFPEYTFIFDWHWDQGIAWTKDADWESPWRWGRIGHHAVCTRIRFDGSKAVSIVSNTF
jgi:hypothetical protein